MIFINRFIFLCVSFAFPLRKALRTLREIECAFHAKFAKYYYSSAHWSFYKNLGSPMTTFISFAFPLRKALRTLREIECAFHAKFAKYC
jgi:hypothetical protein